MSHDHGQRRVRKQHAEIQRPHPALAAEGSRLPAQDGEVVKEVADQEDRGDKKRGKHEDLVGQDATATDRCVSQHQKHRAGAVQGGVDGGQEVPQLGLG